VSGDKLICDIVEVVADDLRLRANSKQIITNTLDQRPFPACRDGTQRVPGMASDKTEL
jgi:hypothetical protein